MTHLLIDDVKLLKPKLGELNPNVTDEEKANRRFYIRAVFALVEAFVAQHRRLLRMQQNRAEGKDVQKTPRDQRSSQGGRNRRAAASR